MQKSALPWKDIVEFHRDIAVRSEEAFFSFALNDQGSERFSFMHANEQVINASGSFSTETFTNADVLLNADQNTSGFFIGGFFWFANKKVNNEWIKEAHPLIYKPFDVKLEANQVLITPEQARWDISPLFYKLLDKKGLVYEGSIDSAIQDMLEKAYGNDDKQSTSESFISLLLAEFPELRKEFIENAPRGFSSNWLLFVAPKDFSAIQKNLIMDYSKLVSNLEKDSSTIGGFELFENHSQKIINSESVKPFVPLNDAQLKVVEKVVSGNEVTVVSGPPGCGKSQVVISLLLNAWEKGQSVLFASSNNKAVDVVRERMKQFGNRIPMVVRCGSRSASELITTLGKIQSVIDNPVIQDGVQVSDDEILNLEKELESINDLLESKVPQRIDELYRSALGAYGKAGECRESLELERSLYEERINKLRISSSIEEYDSAVYGPFLEWQAAHAQMLDEIRKSNLEKHDFESKIEAINNSVINALGKYYSEVSSNRFFTQKNLSDIQTWYDEFKSFLLQYIEADIAPVEWKPEYDRWESSDAVKDWINDSEDTISNILSFLDKFKEDIFDINEKRKNQEIAKGILNSNGIKSLDVETERIIKEWKSLYSRYLMMPTKIIDSLPFSEKRKVDKQLSNYELLLGPLFEASSWSECASEPDKRRRYIVSHTDEMLTEYAACQKVASVVDKINLVQREQKLINDRLSAICNQPIHNIFDIEEVKNVRDNIVADQKVAKEALSAFEKKSKRNSFILQDRELRFKGSRLLYPLMDKIIAQTDVNSFFEILNEGLQVELSLESLQKSRESIYKHSIETYFETLKNVCAFWDELDDCHKKISKCKTDEQWQKEWLEKCPSALLPVFSNMPYSRAIAYIEGIKEEISSIHSDWEEEGKETVAALLSDEESELKWAWDNINKALDLCPENILPDNKETILKKIEKDGWDVSYIRGLFSKISSQGFMIRQSRIKVALEEKVLDKAVTKRLNELNDDNDVKAALASLYMEYQRTNEVITSNMEDAFEKVLKALPLWITTGQSPQSIPMKPGLFDLLVIDEATQCTITSILPLIYRCKRIIVIGDMDQLPAINSISATAERYLADKYNISSYLHVLGHCDCNIYKSVLNMIPVKDGNVILLTDHYRSHPLIIGFSNYYVYRNKLSLKKSMKEIQDNAVLGVFGVNVSGEAYRDSRSDRWCNYKEAERVVSLIKDFSSKPEYQNFSIGVITPFRGQVELLKERLQGQDVFVSTVHQYQGDEKDIIIFSPVVSVGMSQGAAKWVENPQNLINVAVTRAREAFYIVADFEVCRRQPGILGSLVQYTEKIELLRKTSLYELQLFGMMALQGWEVTIHPRISDIEVDFIVSSMGRKIVVEVDGKQHNKQRLNDQNRDAMLAANGYDVVRISTREIVDTPFETVEKITACLSKDLM